MSRSYKDNAEAVRKALNGLYGMCAWDDTEEGSDYWAGVVMRVERIQTNIQARLKSVQNKL